MIISEKNRKEISKYLFQEGVLYAKKDFNLAKHPEIDVPNLQVIKLMQSFKSKEYVRETFAWMHYYWFLTNDGIEFLRTYLNLPSEIVPATLKKQAKPAGRPFGGPPGDRPRGPPRFEGERRFGGDRDGYRGGPRAPGGEFGGEKGGAPADYRPSFGGPGGRSGFGRGAETGLKLLKYMRGIGALLLPKYRLKLSYQEKASAGRVCSLARASGRANLAYACASDRARVLVNERARVACASASGARPVPKAVLASQIWNHVSCHWHCILATLTPKKQENNEFSEMGLATKEIVDPVVAFSKPPPLPPVLGPLVALSLLETWWKGSADDDGK
ncbi:hypothetical protein TanjilG_22907 [Lupinus angustifolius]|uniref:Plectin/eS10 N-terminal domain-containing protein n=1 Tax=Lupinus angustifolius TaxID=3871 RepID=A0A1J7HEM3_LUPAN|nr:hypothetical protein TanjilG_22907 [Lupinus angustifolius]